MTHAPELINALISRYSFILSLNKTPPTEYWKDKDTYRTEIKEKVNELNNMLNK